MSFTQTIDLVLNPSPTTKVAEWTTQYVLDSEIFWPSKGSATDLIYNPSSPKDTMVCMESSCPLCRRIDSGNAFWKLPQKRKSIDPGLYCLCGANNSGSTGAECDPVFAAVIPDRGHHSVARTLACLARI
jgi:hypothetical protein